MRTKAMFFSWSFGAVGIFLLVELSVLLAPFTLFPVWIIYAIAVLIGFFVVLESGDFKIGFFANLSGAIIATVGYFWMGKYMLQNIGNLPAVMAMNAAITSIVTKSLTLYIFSILGNLAAFLVSGIV